MWIAPAAWGFAGVLAMLLRAQPVEGQRPTGPGRQLGVADMVTMAVIGDPGSDRQGGEPRGEVASYSPEGSKVAVIVHRGDLERNLVEARVLVWPLDSLLEGAVADTVAVFASSSNRPAASQLRWLPGGDALLVLGERAGAMPQIYRIDLRERWVRAVTSATREIRAYDIAAGGGYLVYARARPPADADTDSRAGGRMVDAPHIAAALGLHGDFLAGPSTELVVVRIPDGRETPVPEVSFATVPGPGGGRVAIGTCDDDDPVTLSPDGRWVTRVCRVLSPPPGWAAYSDPLLRSGMEPDGWGPSQYVLVDLDTGAARLLMDAPLPLFEWRHPTLWIGESPSLVVANVYLPFGTTGLDSTRVRSSIHVVAVEAPTGALTPIEVGLSRRGEAARVRAARWDPDAGTLHLAREDSAENRASASSYRPAPGRWTRVDTVARSQERRVELTLEESLGARPVLVATDRPSGRRALLLDPNPWLADVRLGHVEEVAWEAPDGTRWRGALYYPVDYVAGKRYPLVIQTHGYDAGRFSLHGGFTTGYAAQPLASHGLMVLQMSMPSAALLGTSQEAPVAQRGLESAVDHFEALGLIDPGHVGVLGFSRTVLHVKYALTHSDYPFAAAVVEDGIDMSYVSYMLFGHIQDAYESLVGAGPPFGGELAAWAREAPGFNLDRVQAPLRIVAIRPEILIGEWEAFSGLRRLGKPVELYYVPNGIHLLVKPRERFDLAQGNVDWFRFWLAGDEDADAEKQGQYARWRAMRAQRDSG